MRANVHCRSSYGSLTASSNGAALWLAGMGLVLMTVFVAWQVFGRYVLNWSTELDRAGIAVMVMSWFIFLGAAVGVRENYHLGFDVLLYCPARRQEAAAARSPTSTGPVRFGIGMVMAARSLPHLGSGARCRRLAIPGGVPLSAARRRRRARSRCSRSSASSCGWAGGRHRQGSTSTTSTRCA